ncbi:DnaJ C terminal region domain containing protein, partial [Entamoeba invadens IP1]|uniref:DnaJ C terminal region domain containing protein n=1 Tax=Entamoeba invadens IP1 TaxID=370355 RepID=UPI0002C3F510
IACHVMEKDTSIRRDEQDRGRIINATKRVASVKEKESIFPNERSNFVVKLQVGEHNGGYQVLKGQGNQYPGQEAGDIKFKFVEQRHPVFRRSGNDLYMEKTIGLGQALTGLSFVVKQLDGRELLLGYNDVIQPETTLEVKGEGFIQPLSSTRGDLFIKFTVIFPKIEEIQKNLEELKKVLPFTEGMVTRTGNQTPLLMTRSTNKGFPEQKKNEKRKQKKKHYDFFDLDGDSIFY